MAGIVARTLAGSGCLTGTSNAGLADYRQELTKGTSMGHALETDRLATERPVQLAVMRM